MKECTKCKKKKPLTEYHKLKGASDGVRSNCKACHLSSAKRYYQENKDAVCERVKDYREKNIDVVRAKDRAYGKANRTKLSDYSKTYKRNKRATDMDFRIMQSLRSRLQKALDGTVKSSTTKELLGCNPDELRGHIESQFTNGISWDNYGVYGWHIDHIIPCASFDLTDPEQQKECFHYTNLQPLWWRDNIIKSDKLPHELTA